MNKFNSSVSVVLPTVTVEDAIVQVAKQISYVNIQELQYKVRNTHLQVNHCLHKL